MIIIQNNNATVSIIAILGMNILNCKDKEYESTVFLVNLVVYRTTLYYRTADTYLLLHYIV